MKQLYLLLLTALISGSSFATLTLTASATPATCGGNDGTIIITVTNGIPPYTYAINGSPWLVSNFFSGLPPGICTIDVMDQMGDMGSINVTISSINAVSVNAGPDIAICAGTNAQLTGTATGAAVYSWSPAAGLNDPSIANPVASPVVSTVYTLTVINGNCTASDNVAVTVMPQPQANAGNDQAVCAGGSVQLLASGGTVYAWSPASGLSDPAIANPVASPVSGTQYTVAVSNGFCISYDTIIVSVVMLPIPIISATANLLTVSNPDANATYSWQFLNNGTWEDIIPAATGIMYTATSTADYRVKAQSGPCTEYSVSVSAGRMAAGNEFGIYMYPNPSTDYLRLDEIKLSEGWELLEIDNSQGSRVLRQNIRNQTSVTVSIAALHNGLYTVRLKRKQGSTVFRFMKL